MTKAKTKWDQKFEELKRFKEEFGHVNVPYQYPQNPKLFFWIYTQRAFYRTSKLALEKVKLLEEVGLEWTISQNRNIFFRNLWQTKYEELKIFKEKFGHTKPSSKDIANKALYAWIYYQKRLYRTNRLVPEKVKLLEEINFKWTNDRKRSK